MAGVDKKPQEYTQLEDFVPDRTEEVPPHEEQP